MIEYVRGKLDEYHYLVHKRHITVTNITRRISGLEGQKRFFPPTKRIYLPDSLPSKWGGLWVWDEREECSER
ncbi:hypothetical protein Csa_013964 [Cucumis sativus]|uniref:Uncharacterized protein n=1 Tax=Cucumis sativus TaxID=3659 RepID=A0A0A0LRW1_CUCSA|nr:hypothetical protein Csa_013964 [Cucumis sativus]